ncbi:hypothetical protein SAY87_029429 [Trapa incisa]|uniref:Uncharacterized protein n=1 Tax=Trapa incisa TaxID=236973 RepID=A0AAN7KEK8_9MYRT|nr:hypothetical protein SAY87_029429 [Trapa incisa]
MKKAMIEYLQRCEEKRNLQKGYQACVFQQRWPLGHVIEPGEPSYIWSDLPN